MKVEEIKNKVRCDMPNCKNMASVKIKKEGFLSFAGLYLCDECVNEVYAELGKRIVPKSPVNVFNKKVRTGVKDGK